MAEMPFEIARSKAKPREGGKFLNTFYISGTGSGLVFVLTGFFIDKTFTTKRRLLMNFNIAAFCAAGVVFPEIILYVTGMFGGNGILLFAGGLLLPALALCVFIA